MMVTLRRVQIPLCAVCEGNIYSDRTIKQQNAIVCNNMIIRYDACGRVACVSVLITSLTMLPSPFFNYAEAHRRWFNIWNLLLPSLLMNFRKSQCVSETHML